MDWHIGIHNKHVEHHQPKPWHIHNWYQQSAPQCHSTNSHHPSRNKRPSLLRLNSQGHEEVPTGLNQIERPPLPSRNQQRVRSFAGNIYSKVSHPFTTRTSTAQHFVKTSNQALQGEINLEALAEKFSSGCSVESTNKMVDREMMHRSQRQAYPAMPRVMNFNGGPYITYSSQNNNPKSFPACYRFLNLVHFHPYTTANRYDQPVKVAWGTIPTAAGISQSRYHHNIRQDSHFHALNVPLMGSCKNPVSRPRNHCLNAHHGNKGSAEMMMQTRHCMSHQNSQHGKSNASKITSPSSQVQIETKTSSKVAIETPTSIVSLFHDGSSPTTDVCASPSDIGKQIQSPSDSTAPKEPSDAATFIDTKVPASPNFVDDTCNNHTTETKTITNYNVKHKHLQELNQSAASDSVPSQSDRELHSSIAYLLGDYSAESPAGSFDSDFSDADEETLDEELACGDQELLESFLTNDIYNPLDGWKCPSHPTANKSDSDTVTKVDRSTRFNDSGVSEQMVDDAGSQDDDVSSDTSDEWSDSGCDEEDCDEKEQRLWDSLNHCKDPYDPLQGWRCHQNISNQDDSKDLLQDNVTQDNSPQETVSLDITDSPSQKTAANFSQDADVLHSFETPRHSSVSFILGADDYDSSSDSDSDDETSQLQDELWSSFEATNDPYDPMNGWRCQSPSSPSPLQRSTSSPSVLCTDTPTSETISSDTKHALPEIRPTCSSQMSSSAAVGILLKSSSSAGCLVMWRTRKVFERKPKKVR